MIDSELRPPLVESFDQTGLILDVEGISIEDPAAPAYLRCTDGLRLRIPDSLFEWAAALIDDNHQRRAAGTPSLFPIQIEFGSLDGTLYAEVL